MRRYIPERARPIPEKAERKFKGEIFEVWQWPQEMFDGTTETFEMLKRDDTVGIIAILTAEEARRLGKDAGIYLPQAAEFRAAPREEKQASPPLGFCEIHETNNDSAEKIYHGMNNEARIVVTYQTQPDRDWFYAFPGGRCDHPEEDELAAAKRELREETGMVFRNWKLVDARQPYSKMDWIDYLFVATGFVEQVPQDLDAGEKIEVREMTWAEMLEHAKTPEGERLLNKTVRRAKSLDDLINLPTMFEY